MHDTVAMFSASYNSNAYKYYGTAFDLKNKTGRISFIIILWLLGCVYKCVLSKIN